MLRKFASYVLLLILITAYLAAAQTAPVIARSVPNEEWTFPPFRILANVDYVGTYDLASYLITTPQGHILINSGLRDTVPQIEANVRQLGFKMTDIKIITATHAHWDHAAGLAELKRITGAQMMMSAEDAEVLESGGHTDFRWGADRDAWFEPVKVDRRLQDGDAIQLGNVKLTAHLHPGHTKGATSFTMKVPEGGKTYVIGIMNMGTINPGVRVSGMPQYPNIADDYARTFRDQKSLRIDVFLSSHASQFKMHEKYKPGDPYEPERFVDPNGYRMEVERLEKIFEDQLQKERSTKK